MTRYNSHLTLKNNSDIELGKNFLDSYEIKEKEKEETHTKSESEREERVFYISLNHST